MKLTESQLRSIIRKELQEMMTPEFGESEPDLYDDVIGRITALEQFILMLNDEGAKSRFDDLLGYLHEAQSEKSGFDTQHERGPSSSEPERW
jgi:hypothetical protein